MDYVSAGAYHIVEARSGTIVTTECGLELDCGANGSGDYHGDDLTEAKRTMKPHCSECAEELENEGRAEKVAERFKDDNSD